MDSLFSALVDQEVAGFRLVQWLGEGGMAGVFKGENVLNPAIARAIKVVRTELSARREFTQRFAQEAVILEKLKHPNVVRFYGLRHEKRPQGDLLLMELELLEGETLTGVVRRIRAGVPLRSAVEWIRAAAEGVAAAHDLGVIHRDLKPDNIFLTITGEIKVLDFGIARAHDEADRTERLTTVGSVPGSPAYMAPEVCMGAVPAATGDVYALGISLYEILIGQHPFAGPDSRMSSTQLMFAQVNNQLPPLRDLRPDAPVSLEQVLTRATAKDPSWRFASARELADALGNVLREGVDPGGESEEVAAPAVGTQFNLPQMFNARTTPRGSVPDARPSRAGSNPDGRNSRPDLRLSQSEIRAQTTGSTPLLQDPSAQPKKGKGGLVAGIALAAIVAGGVLYMTSFNRGVAPPNAALSSATKPPASASAAPPLPPQKNVWIHVEPPPAGSAVLLGISDEKAPNEAVGFRPSRRIGAPGMAYDIQQHEVTWDELDEWLAANQRHAFTRPKWVPEEPKARAQWPATGVPWDTARTYCKSIGGALPTEEEWEFAARGPQRRAYSWGSQRIDLSRTRAYAPPQISDAGTGPTPVAPVMTMDQDQTPDEDAVALYDMTGNALEWTADLYRENLPKVDESWAEEGGVSYRAVRGLPLDVPPPHKFPIEGAAYRVALCATGPCPKGVGELLQYVGFRCSRRAVKHAAAAPSDAPKPPPALPEAPKPSPATAPSENPSSEP